MHNNRSDSPWYEITADEILPSLSVLVSRAGVVANIAAVVARASGSERLRPHVKTHKSAHVVHLHLGSGITRFKCATPAEAEMLAQAAVPDVLIAYQLVGPGPRILRVLVRKYRGTRFGCLVDDESTLDRLEAEFERTDLDDGASAAFPGHRSDQGGPLVFVDLDVGMHRTGIAPGDRADQLYRRIAASTCMKAGGIHAYDGHIRETSPEKRAELAAHTRTIALAMRDRLQHEGFTVPEVVLGGTPKFPCHADAYVEGCTLSPGTYYYHDWGYATSFPDLPFRAAAVVLGRVISVPTPGRFTIDVGSKAIAAYKDQPRGTILNIPCAEAGPQSEEHWVFTNPGVVQRTVARARREHLRWAQWCTYGRAMSVPRSEHYDEVLAVGSTHEIVDRWPVTARCRAVADGITGFTAINGKVEQ